MKRFDVKDALSLVTVVVTALFSWMQLPRLPSWVAVHFDIYGRPDGFAPPAFAALALPAFGLFIWAFLRVSPYLVPKRRREAALAAPLSSTGLLTMIFLCVLQFVLIENALGAGLDMMTVIACLMGCLFIGLAFIMLGTRPNPLVGIRTRWTLGSEDNWIRTHKLAALTFIGAGIAAIASPLAGAPASVFLLLAAVLIAALIPTIYSWVLAKRGV
jgi:uncharacterized membrane protein